MKFLKSLVDSINKTIICLFEKHKLVRRFLVFWAVWLITIVTLRITETNVILNIKSEGVTVFLGVVGILTTVIGFYQWHRETECKRKMGKKNATNRSIP